MQHDPLSWYTDRTLVVVAVTVADDDGGDDIFIFRKFLSGGGSAIFLSVIVVSFGLVLFSFVRLFKNQQPPLTTQQQAKSEL